MLSRTQTTDHYYNNKCSPLNLDAPNCPIQDGLEQSDVLNKTEGTASDYKKQFISQSKKPRLDFVDYAKAVVIAMMVFGHLPSNSLSEAIGKYIFAFHMAIFFMISGMFVKKTSLNFKEVVVRPFKQLLIPYFGFSIIAFSICWISPYLHPELYKGINGWTEIFKAAFIGLFYMTDKVTEISFMPLGPLWFLVCLFWCKLLTQIWLKNYIGKICILFGIFLIEYFQIEIFSLSSLYTAFPFFIAGYYSKGLIIKVSKSAMYVKVCLLLVCTSVLVVFTDSLIGFDGGDISGNPVMAFARAFAGSVLLLILSMFISVFPKVIKNYISLIGKATLVILATHFYFTISGKVLYVLFGGSIDSFNTLYALIIVVITVGLGPIMHAFIEQYVPCLLGKFNGKQSFDSFKKGQKMIVTR